MTLPAARILELSGSDLPQRARGAVQSDIWVIGNIDLLSRPAIGICGSRGASETGLEHALNFGHEVAANSAVVVSGYAKGVDRQAHKGALEGGGATIAVLPEGIRHFRIVRELRSLVDLQTNFLAVSMFRPDDRWQTWRAMERNKLIVGLSLALFVVEAKERGGTVDAAEQSRRQGKPVYVVDFVRDLPGREGNRELIRQFGQPIKNVRELRDALEVVLAAGYVPAGKQLSLTMREESGAYD